MTDKHFPFHASETAVQTRAGVPDKHIERVRKTIRSEMPDQHRQFFESLPVLFAGLADQQGRVWSTPVFGPPGFMQSPTPDRLHIAGLPVLTRELNLDLSIGSKIGALGMELTTRRRNRVNGTLIAKDGGLLGAIDQSFGNCPQYIQVRRLQQAAHSVRTVKAQRLDAMTPAAQTIINQTDTFFIASRTSTLSDDPRSGLDASHRGGRPGFLCLNGDGSLSFPDFAGNNFFNTIGNIENDGRIGLFIPDFENHQALFITGRGRVDWTSSRISAFQGAQRIIDITPAEIWLAHDAIPHSYALEERWPRLTQTGTWSETDKSQDRI